MRLFVATAKCGPWKFGDLPGMILASAVDDYVSWEAIGRIKNRLILKYPKIHFS
jgi:GLPGLI family protein